MMKSMEWGAIVYLTYSKYGRCKDNQCTEVRINNSDSYVTGASAIKEPKDQEEKYTDHGSNNLGEDVKDIVANYNNQNSVQASTTGNYYGIYDMVGGAWEYVMGVMGDANGKPVSGINDKNNSNFVGTLSCPKCESTINNNKTEWTSEDNGLAWPEKKYYDVYSFNESGTNFNYGLLGDATKEFGPFYNALNNPVGSWYMDYADFVYIERPWLIRGGRSVYGINAGMIAFSGTYGHESTNYTFRVVLTP